MPEPTWPKNWSDLDHSALPWRYEVDVDTMPSPDGGGTQYRLWAIYACPPDHQHPEEYLILMGEEMEEGCDPTATLRWICDTHNRGLIAQPTEYRLSPVPVTAVRDGYKWDVTVRRYIVPGQPAAARWVVQSMFEVLAEPGEWEHDPWPRYEKDRVPEWELRHCLTLDAALRLAERAQWTLEVNGKTAADVLSESEGAEG